MSSPQSMDLMGMCSLVSDRLSPESSQILWIVCRNKRLPFPSSGIKGGNNYKGSGFQFQDGIALIQIYLGIRQEF